jgi:hypothetical protein
VAGFPPDGLPLSTSTLRAASLVSQLLKNAEGFDGVILSEESEEALNVMQNPVNFLFDTGASM